MRILKLLNVDNFYGQDESIEIAKGKNKLPETFKEGFKQIKRHTRWKKSY
jgi:hypothetical protein|tara:strand:- start:423 stop:572 length:150 start_codon:yes stop_codon:yes gene_type:complete